MSSTGGRQNRADYLREWAAGCGVDVTGMGTYCDTYIREDGRWLCIQAQLKAVAPQNDLGDETIENSYVNGQLQPR